MGKYIDRAKELRNDTSVHYNCAQATLAAFAADAGLTEEAALRVTANFGSGMKMGETCGAVTGGLMALGLYGVEDSGTTGQFCRAIASQHGGCLACRDLLRRNKAEGRPQKEHCDGMVYESVALVEKILAERGCIQDL